MIVRLLLVPEITRYVTSVSKNEDPGNQGVRADSCRETARCFVAFLHMIDDWITGNHSKVKMMTTQTNEND